MIVASGARIIRGRRKTDDVDKREVRWGGPFILVSGGVIPALILAGVFAVSVRDQALLSKAADDSVMTIDVVGHLWWWEARYPNGAVTANEIHIPAGEIVRLRLTTDDVIHSVWVPNSSQTDMINGHVNYMWLDADEPGPLPRSFAEFCGWEHAKMLFTSSPSRARPSTMDGERGPRRVGLPSRRPPRTGEDLTRTVRVAGCPCDRGNGATRRWGGGGGPRPHPTS